MPQMTLKIDSTHQLLVYCWLWWYIRQKNTYYKGKQNL